MSEWTISARLSACLCAAVAFATESGMEFNAETFRTLKDKLRQTTKTSKHFITACG